MNDDRDILIGIVILTPIMIFAIVAMVRWRQFCAKHSKPMIQFFVSDLLLTSLFVGGTLVVLSHMGQTFGQYQSAVQIAMPSGIFAGLICGKVFSLTTSAPVSSYTEYLVVGAICGLLLSVCTAGFVFICWALWALSQFHGW